MPGPPARPRTHNGESTPGGAPGRPWMLLAALALTVCPSRNQARAAAPGPAPPSDPAAVAFFESAVRPILVERCHGCHGSAKAKAGLRLDSRAGVLAGGESGPAIVPGAPRESLLIDAIN